MIKNGFFAIGLLAILLATNAWAGNAKSCLEYIGKDNHPYLTNTCDFDVEASWCVGESCKQFDNSWTLRSGMKMPVEGRVWHLDGCKGANAIKCWEGLQVTCRE